MELTRIETTLTKIHAAIVAIFWFCVSGGVTAAGMVTAAPFGWLLAAAGFTGIVITAVCWYRNIPD